MTLIINDNDYDIIDDCLQFRYYMLEQNIDMCKEERVPYNKDVKYQNDIAELASKIAAIKEGREWW